VGLKKCHIVNSKAATTRPSQRRGFLSQRVKKVRMESILMLVAPGHLSTVFVHAIGFRVRQGHQYIINASSV
jgi:hypothetical protein